jgi:predicted ATPase
MEILQVKNFSTIRQANFEVKRFNMIIGPQASGKSVIAKLLYFFRKFITEQFVASIQRQLTKRDVVKEGISKFEEMFPRYIWSEQEFSIVYEIDGFEISIVRKKTEKGKTSLKFDYSSNFSEIHRRVKQAYQKKL